MGESQQVNSVLLRPSSVLSPKVILVPQHNSERRGVYAKPTGGQTNLLRISGKLAAIGSKSFGRDESNVWQGSPSLIPSTPMSKMRLIILAAIIGGSGVVSTSGCVIRATPRAHVVSTAPQMVQISPGVWVVENHNQSVFYSDGYYWQHNNGVWMRSSYYTGGFVRVRAIPSRVRTIRRPRSYVRYRGRAGAKRRAQPVRRGGAVRSQPRSRTAPARRGAAPARRGAAPARRGAAPARRGAAPARRGAAPARRGAAPARKAAPARRAKPVRSQPKARKPAPKKKKSQPRKRRR